MSTPKAWRWLPVASLAGALALLWTPLLALALASFNATRSGGAWGGATLRWYRELSENTAVRRALLNTLLLAGVSTLIATALGTALAVGLERHPRSGRSARWVRAVADLPLIAPDVLFAAALLIAMQGLRALSSVFEPGLTLMVLGHVSFQLSFVALVVRSRLAALGPSLAEAAHDLYATPAQAFGRVTLPLIAPAIGCGAVLAFVLSLDDVVVSFFAAGPGSETLPILIYGSMRRGLSPQMHALSTLVVLLSAGLVLALERLTRRSPWGA